MRAGLQDLVTATGSAEEANRLLGPAMDIARLAGVDLETASKALAKAHDGNDAALRKLIPGLEKGKTATDTIAEATELASGQADIYAKSSEGMGKAGSDAFAEIGETIGSAFLPIMDEVVPALIPIIQELGELIKELLPLLKPVIDAIVVRAADLHRGAADADRDHPGRGAVHRGHGPEGAGRGQLHRLGGPQPVRAAGRRRGRLPRAHGPLALGSRGGGGGGGGGVTVNVYGGDPHAITRAVARGYRGWTGISGSAAARREY